MHEEQLTSYEHNQNVAEECLRLIDEAQKAGLILRAYGGAAIWLRCHSIRKWLGRHDRHVKDIDLVCKSRQLRSIVEFLKGRGYSEDPYTARYSTQWQRTFMNKKWKVDLSVDRLVYCHTVDLRGRLKIDGPTISLSDLFLSKAQNVNLTTSDQLDLIALCEEYDVVGQQGKVDAIEVRRVTDVLRKNWGFCRTVLDNIDLIISHVLTMDELTKARERLEAIKGTVLTVPKTPRWYLRSIVRSHFRWYTKVD